MHGDWLVPAPPQQTVAVAQANRSANAPVRRSDELSVVVQVPASSRDLSDEDRKVIDDAQDQVAELTGQIETLKALLEEQRAQTAVVSDDSETVQETVTALTARIGQLEDRQEKARTVLTRYGTPVRPQNSNLQVGKRRASETFPKIPYFKPGITTEGEMWVEPTVTDTGLLTFNFNFIDPQAEYDRIADTITMSLEELRSTEEALRRIQNWNRTARENRIRKRFDKEATCFPDAMCASRTAGNASTSIIFQIDDDGSTETQIVRNKGSYQDKYGYSMESALLLISYLQHVEKEGSFDYDAGTQTKESLDALFE